MVFLIECIVICVLFNVLIYASRKGGKVIYASDYPAIITERLKNKGLITEKPKMTKKDVIKKLIAMLFFAFILAFVVHYFNGANTFLEGMCRTYAIWFVVDWYDFLVMDVLEIGFTYPYKETGVSGFCRESVLHHLKGSLIGMALGLFVAVIAGLFVMIL